MGKILFPQERGTPLTCSFPGFWSLPGGEGYPSPRFFSWSFLGGAQSQFFPWKLVLRGGDASVPGGGGGGRVPPSQDRTGVSPLVRTGLWQKPLSLSRPVLEYQHSPTTRQNSRANTCYAAGGMPLGVTQEDLLVYIYFSVFPEHITSKTAVNAT